MRKEIYPLLCLLAFTIIFSSATAQSICDSVFIEPDIETIEVCPEGSVVLTVNGGSNFSWSPDEDFDDPLAQTVTLTPSGSQWYFVTFDAGDTTCTDSVFISIPAVMPTFSVNVSTTETICPLDPVTVTFVSNLNISEISWNTTAGVIDSESVTGTVITPLETTEYIVTALVGGCTLMDTFTIDVILFRFRLTHPDTIYVCLGDSGVINHTLFPLGANVVWNPLDSTINLLTQSTAFVKPTISTSYTATATFMGCVLSTTTFVRVDSLPDTALVVIPVMDPYCAGEMITIFAERADTMKYPDIEFEWFPMDGQIRDSTNTGNVFVVLQDTTQFFRVMRNNACLDTSSVIVNVIPPEIPLSVMDTTLCPGDMFLVEILDLDVMEIEWTPKQGLSCNDCFNPTVTVQPNPITYMVQGKKDRCTVTGMLNVTIFPALPIIITPSSAFACPGDQIAFSFSDTLLSNIEISVTGNGTVSCTDCANPVVTYGGGLVQLFVNADETSDMHCGAQGVATISLKPNETQQLTPIEICENVPTPIQLPADLVNPMLSINNGGLSCNDCLNPTVTITQTTTLFIDSESQSENSCTLRTSVTLAVPLDDEVTFDLGSEPPFGQGEVVSITLVTDPMPDPGTIYEWMINGGTPITGPASTISAPLNEQSNMIHVEWTNSSGCMQSADTIITTVPPTYKIPNAFTPDRELNTHFKVDIVGNIQIIEMLVFNRWGQVVYEGTSDEGWDGRRDGEQAPPEVYVYLIRLRDPGGREIIEKGDVTLIR